MLSRRDWVNELIGYVLRQNLADDPDWVFEMARELYPEWGDVAPGLAANSAFGPEGLQPH